MNLAAWCALLAAVVFCAGSVLFGRYRANRLLNRLNRMLDDAIAGSFDETTYDESRLSQIEAKLGRFLAQHRQFRKHLEKERDKIKTLISDISHQTKTPIANIVLYTQLLREQADLPKPAEALAGQIQPQAEKLNFLIQSLIKASRLESGIVTVQPSPNPVSELIENALSECRPKAQAKNIYLTAEADAGLLARFDRKWTAEALYNIVDNAVKYTPPGGRVAIRARAYELFVRIDVADSGIGIPEHEHAKLFERFWRSPSVADTEGVGIGLYLAREIVAMENGYISLRSEPGKGTVFSLFLPKA